MSEERIKTEEEVVQGEEPLTLEELEEVAGGHSNEEKPKH